MRRYDRSEAQYELQEDLTKAVTKETEEPPNRVRTSKTALRTVFDPAISSTRTPSDKVREVNNKVKLACYFPEDGPRARILSSQESL